MDIYFIDQYVIIVIDKKNENKLVVVDEFFGYEVVIDVIGYLMYVNLNWFLIVLFVVNWFNNDLC